MVKITLFVLGILLVFTKLSYSSQYKWKGNSVSSTEYGDIFFLEMFENGLQQKNFGIAMPSNE